ncbi:Multiple inositol polyphosphate phosphatase 1, partial [Pseudolycoriella hygida]
MFATTTAYETVRGRNLNPNVSTCTPSKFWMVSRHGTRLPAVANLRNILDNYERLHREVLSNYASGRTSLCASDFALIRDWTFDRNITLEISQHLTSSGWKELEELAYRYQSAYPSILSSTYSPNDYLFRFADTQRTEASLRAFADGLFGINGSDQVRFEDIPAVDTFLLPQTSCPLWVNVTSTQIEHLEFRDGVEYQQMLGQVSAKLGFHGSHTLRPNEVEMFAFGYGFSSHRRLFENLPCFLMQDLLNFLQSNDDADHKAKVYNTNGTPLMILMVTLGAFEDDVPLTRHNFAQQTERLWKTSFISPMATNLAVIRYDCFDGDHDILFLYNEKPLRIAGCQSNGLCKMS